MLTDSEKLTATVVLGLTLLAPLVGTVLDTVGRVLTVKEVETSAGRCWPASTSVTWRATTVPVQVTGGGSAEVGWRTKLEAGEAGVTVKAMDVPVGHSSLKAVPVTFTDSEKLMVIVAEGFTLTAPLVG